MYRNNAFKAIHPNKPQAVKQVIAEPVKVEQKPLKMGYKGFNKDLSCNSGSQKHIYEIGVVYEKPEKVNPKPCSNDGFHYCNNLNDVFKYYHRDNGHRFCEVQILGNHADEGDKSITTKIKVLREIPESEIEKLSYESAINLATIRKIQYHNPFLHLGGSAALYLYGIQLDRIKENGGCPSDIDMISPFYHYLVGDKDDKIEPSDSKNSGNDFDESFYFNGVGVDLRIDPRQKYNLIKHDGFTYKVSAYEIIMQAKLKYALNKQSKHKSDCDEIMGIKINEKPKTAPVEEELPF
jgi:hypothetical protein